MSAEKSLLALDYVHLKGQQYSRERGKRFCKRTLGDVEKRHKILPPKSNHKLHSTMMSMEFEETRAVNHVTAQQIIFNQSAQIKNTYSNKLRSCQLNEWQSTPVKQNQINKKKFSSTMNNERRPATATVFNSTHTSLVPSIYVRPFSTGSRVKLASSKTANREYVRVQNKKMGGFRDIDIRKVANELRQSWVNEDNCEEVKTPRKQIKSVEISQNDIPSGHWLTFAGKSSEIGGTVGAFLGNDVDEHYKIEGQVGSVVANQVSNGNQIQVCINGELQSEDMKVRKLISNDSNEKVSSEKPVSPVSTVPSMAKPSTAPNVANLLEDRVPLSWEDQVTRPSVKILEASAPRPNAVKKDTTERYPVVFQKLLPDEKPRPNITRPNSYRVHSRTKNQRSANRMDSLNNRITYMTVDQCKEDDADSLASDDYHEILQRRLEAGEKPLEDQKDEGKEEVQNSKIEPKKKSSKEIIRSKSSISNYSPSKESLNAPQEKQLPPSGSVKLVAQGSNPNITSNRPNVAQNRPSSSIISNKVPRSGSSKRGSLQEDRQTSSATQRSQLAKPGYLSRSGSAIKEREKEFVSISHQIRIPSGTSLKKQASFQEFEMPPKEQLEHESSDDELDASIGKLSPFNSMDSLDSFIDNDATDHDHQNWSCTPEAKMSVSVAISGAPSTVINVNLPKVQMSTSYLTSEQNTSGDPCDSSLSRQGIVEQSIEDLTKTSIALVKTVKSRDLLKAASKEENDPDNEVNMILNQVDGLSIVPEVFQATQETQGSSKRPKNVKFQDEVIANTPNVPTNSPRSHEHNGDF